MSEIQFQSKFAARKAQEDKVFQQLIQGVNNKPQISSNNDQMKNQESEKLLKNDISEKQYLPSIIYQNNGNTQNETDKPKFYEPSLQKQERTDSKGIGNYSGQNSQKRSYQQSQRAGVSNDFNYYDSKVNSNILQINRVKPEEIPASQRMTDNIIPNEIFAKKQLTKSFNGQDYKSSGLNADLAKQQDYSTFSASYKADQNKYYKPLVPSQEFKYQDSKPGYSHQQPQRKEYDIIRYSLQDQQLSFDRIKKEDQKSTSQNYDQKIEYNKNIVVEEVTDGYTEYFSQGCDFDGQLGHGLDPNVHDRKKIVMIPKSLSFDILIKSISCGASFTMILSKSGELFSIGSNEFGQLGLNDKVLSFTTAPLLVQEIQNKGIDIKKIACGSNHCLLLSKNGLIYSWGSNSFGQCGISELQDSNENSPRFQREASEYLKIYSPQRIHSDVLKQSQIKDMQCGSDFSGFLTDKGEVYTFGDNKEGQLAIGNQVRHYDQPSRVKCDERVAQISLGYQHILFLSYAGRILGAGRNKEGQLGTIQQYQNQSNFLVPKRLDILKDFEVKKVIAGSFSAAIVSNNHMSQVYVWGQSLFGTFEKPQKVLIDQAEIIDVKIGKYSKQSFGFALDRNGKIYSWGENSLGQLGHGDQISKQEPTQIMALKRKNISQMAIGNGFVVLLGRDISLAEQNLKKEKRKQQKLLKQNQGSSYVQSKSQQLKKDNFKNEKNYDNESDYKKQKESFPERSEEYSLGRVRPKSASQFGTFQLGQKEKDQSQNRYQGILNQNQSNPKSSDSNEFKTLPRETVNQNQKYSPQDIQKNNQKFVGEYEGNKSSQFDRDSSTGIQTKFTDNISGFEVKGSLLMKEKLQYMDQIETLKEKLQNKIEQMENFQAETKERDNLQQEKINNLKSKVQTLQEQLYQKEDAIQDLSQLLEDKKKENNHQIQTIKESEKINEELQESLDQIRNDFEIQLRNKSQEKDELAKELDDAALKNHQLMKMIKSKQNEIDKIQSQQQDIKEYKKKIAKLEGIVDELQEKNQQITELLNKKMIDKAENFKQQVQSYIGQTKVGTFEKNDEPFNYENYKQNSHSYDSKAPNFREFFSKQQDKKLVYGSGNKDQNNNSQFLSKYGQEIIRYNNGINEDFQSDNRFLKEPKSALPPQMEEFGESRGGGNNSYKQLLNQKSDLKTRSMPRQSRTNNYQGQSSRNQNECEKIYQPNSPQIINNYDNGSEQIYSYDQRKELGYQEGLICKQSPSKGYFYAKNSYPEDTQQQKTRSILNDSLQNSYTHYEQSSGLPPRNRKAFEKEEPMSSYEKVKSLRLSHANFDVRSNGFKQKKNDKNSGFRDSDINMSNQESHTERRRSFDKGNKSLERKVTADNSPNRREVLSAHIPSQRISQGEVMRKSYQRTSNDHESSKIDEDESNIQSQIEQKLNRIQKIFKGQQRQSDRINRDDDDGSFIERATFSQYGQE